MSIHGLDERVKERLRVRAARHGRSMEAEAPPPDAAVVEWVGSAGPELWTTAVTMAEIRYGPERLTEGRRKDRLRAEPVNLCEAPVRGYY
jgi:plasmid stability protein